MRSGLTLPNSASLHGLGVKVSRNCSVSLPTETTNGCLMSLRACLGALGTQLLSLKKQILELDRMIMAWYRSNETSRRLHYIPGVGPLLATALVDVADPGAFRSGRNFSAWIGLVPKQYSSGGKDTLGSISKQGDRYLRSLFVAILLGARSNRVRCSPSGHRPPSAPAP
jgi:transposase